MCGLKDIIRSGYEDLISQKKKNRISFVLITISLLIFVGVNSAVSSIEGIADSIVKFPESRIIKATYLDEEGDVYNKLEQVYHNDEKIKDVFKTAINIQITWCNIEEYFGIEEEDVYIESFYKPLIDYVSNKNIKELAYNEVLIPKYIYDIGKYDKDNYFDGERLVGKSIQIEFRNIYNYETMEKFELKVVGTYDNLATRLSADSIYLNQEFVNYLLELDYKAELETAEEFKQEMVDLGLDPETYIVEKRNCVGMYIDEKYDIHEVMEQISQETDCDFSQSVTVSQETFGFYNYVTFVSNLVAFFLLFVGFINIVISSISEVKERRWEFALKLTMGYTYRDVIRIFFVEKWFNMLKSLVVSIVTVIIGSIIITVIFKNFMGRYGVMYNFGIDNKYTLLAILLILLAVISGTISGWNSIREIEEASVLKSGD